MIFRKDVNGLRAIAVIAVVLYHFNASWLPGGFAGVDVFFVISGFLMTGIIFRGIEQDNFSILKFYVARANRIIPALAFLCLVLLIFTWVYLTPLDYKVLGKYVASSLGFFSNILYWKEIGYFDARAHQKWLLHTWSLSAEWQFYMLYPLTLVVMRKFISIKIIKSIIILGTVLGFIVCIVVTYAKPDPAYYLLPTRAWEMMVGGIAYLYPFTIKEERKRLVEWTGVALIFTSYLFFSKENPWPGYLAIFPVLGSFLIIQAQRNNSFITNNIVFQKLGEWSYSIYLWHWPLVVGIYYFSLNDEYVYLGIALSTLLGFLSYKYIEKINLRNDFDSTFSYLRCKPLHMVFIGSILSTTIFYNANYFYDMPESIFDAVIISPATDGHSEYTWKLVHEFDKKISFKDVKHKVLTIGDSQSGDFINALYGAGLSQNVDVVSRMVKMRCEVFYIDENSLKESFKINENIINGYVSEELCKNQIERIQKDPIVEQATIIILSMLWKDKNMPYVIQSIENIREANEKAIIYIVGGKSFNKSIQKIIYESHYNDVDLELSAFDEIANDKNVNIDFQSHIFNKNKDVLRFEYIDIMSTLCDSNKCAILTGNNLPVYFDDTHTTPVGAEYIGMKIKKRNIFPSGFYLAE
ncbi:acyltransferase [Moritella sp. 5]|uniref:acyltransferase family protein n=1 Tax=Moritella sp. 5 TaxID=2746231 RepID=UPI001BAE0638|nr:acyltransferase family protein [Moritella sp. 5]QUM81035.1 acyltransferase [Moritella sp. 5]